MLALLQWQQQQQLDRWSGLRLGLAGALADALQGLIGRIETAA